MLKAQMDYGAIATKVRALQGRLLTEADFQRLAAMGSVEEVVAFLRGSGAWREAMGSLPPGSVDAAAVERALREQLSEEYRRLYLFASSGDRKFLLFLLYRTEYSLILATLRRLFSPHSLPPREEAPAFVLQKSKADLTALRRSRDYPSLLASVKETIFYPSLAALPVDAGTHLPDYGQASIALEHRYYSEIYRFLGRRYSGPGRQQLLAQVGTEADMLNIAHLIRLRRNFPGSLPQSQALLIPVRYRLTNAFVEALIAARSEAEVGALLKASPWAAYFPEGETAVPERQYDRFQEAFCRKLLRSTQPSICLVQAYLTLKELSCARLRRIIEAIRCGVNPTDVI